MRTVISPISGDPLSLTAFVEHLHAVRENDRTALARELHDDVGTMLVASAMELGWVESRTAVPEINERLQRLGRHLADLIKINRRSIEQLRPTLLETFGLFEALRWNFKGACHDHPAQCRAQLPDIESRLDPYQLTHVFRATQTLLECTLQEGDLMTMDLEAAVNAEMLVIQLGHRHLGSEPKDVLTRFQPQLTSASHRISALGGQLTFESFEDGAIYGIQVPLAVSAPITSRQPSSIESRG